MASDVEQYMNVLERTLKEVSVVYSRYYPGIFVEGLRKTTNILRHNIQRSVRTNPVPQNTNLQRYL
jgi:hypothetical protein